MMVCRDAGSRDLTSHVATLQCCMLQCATIRLLQEAVRVDTAVVGGQWSWMTFWKSQLKV